MDPLRPPTKFVPFTEPPTTDTALRVVLFERPNKPPTCSTPWIVEFSTLTLSIVAFTSLYPAKEPTYVVPLMLKFSIVKSLTDPPLILLNSA